MDTKEQEYEIDLTKLGRILWQKKKQVGALCVAGAVLGAAYPLIQPVSYSSTAEVQVRSDVSVGNLFEAKVETDNQTTINIMSIVELLRSPGVIEATVDSIAPDSEHDKTVLKSTLTKGLKIEQLRGTDLIKITAQGRTPEEAQQFTKGLTDNFIRIHSSNKQAIQVRKSDFLYKQVADAKRVLMETEEKVIAAPKDEFNPIYRQLQREAKIKEDIYINLVKETESSRIREQMNSEEIQLVSPANLPTTESGSRSKNKLFAVVGFAVGALLSLGYGILCYRKEN